MKLAVFFTVEQAQGLASDINIHLHTPLGYTDAQVVISDTYLGYMVSFMDGAKQSAIFEETYDEIIALIELHKMKPTLH